MKHLRENANSSLRDYSQGTYAPDRMPEKRRRWNWTKVLPFVVRLILGAIFIYASLDKILHPGAFAQAIYNYQILPGELINLTAIVLPWLELILGLFMIVGLWLPGATFLCTLLLLTFFGALLFNALRGLHIDCGCFSTSAGTPSDIPMAWYVLRDGVFLLLALYLSSHILFRNWEVLDESPRQQRSPL